MGAGYAKQTDLDYSKIFVKTITWTPVSDYTTVKRQSHKKQIRNLAESIPSSRKISHYKKE